MMPRPSLQPRQLAGLLPLLLLIALIPPLLHAAPLPDEFPPVPASYPELPPVPPSSHEHGETPQ